MIEILHNLVEYLRLVWQTLGEALRLNPELVETVEAVPEAFWVVLAIPFLAGISMLLGHSIVLFANRITPGRFVWSLLIYGVYFICAELLSAMTIWLVAGWVFDADQSFSVALRIIFLASAPLVLGVFILIPHFGALIEWILRVWGVLIAINLVGYTFGLVIWQAVVTAVLAWALLQIVERIFNRPLTVVRDAVWRGATRTDFDQQLQADIDEAIAELRGELETNQSVNA